MLRVNSCGFKLMQFCVNRKKRFTLLSELLFGLPNLAKLVQYEIILFVSFCSFGANVYGIIFSLSNTKGSSDPWHTLSKQIGWFHAFYETSCIAWYFFLSKYYVRFKNGLSAWSSEGGCKGSLATLDFKIWHLAVKLYPKKVVFWVLNG